MRTDPQEILLKMIERYGHESPEAVREKKAQQDGQDREFIKSTINKRRLDVQKRETLNKYRGLGRASGMFKKVYQESKSSEDSYRLPLDYEPKHEVVIQDKQENGKQQQEK